MYRLVVIDTGHGHGIYRLPVPRPLYWPWLMIVFVDVVVLLVVFDVSSIFLDAADISNPEFFSFTMFSFSSSCALFYRSVSQLLRPLRSHGRLVSVFLIRFFPCRRLL